MQNKLRPPKVKIDREKLNRKEVGFNMDVASIFPRGGFMNEYITKIIKEVDEFTFKQFERHGYSRDEVVSLAKEERIYKVRDEIKFGSSTLYMLDDEPLFEIVSQFEKNFEDGSVVHKLVCNDYKEVKDDVNHDD